MTRNVKGIETTKYLTREESIDLSNGRESFDSFKVNQLEEKCDSASRHKKYGLQWFYKAKRKNLNNPNSDEEDNGKPIVRRIVRNFDQKKLLELINSKTVDINETSPKGITALHEAAIDGNLACLQILVENGADISKADNEGYTSLDYAVLGGHFDCAAFLVSKGSNTDHIKNGNPYFRSGVSHR